MIQAHLVYVDRTKNKCGLYKSTASIQVQSLVVKVPMVQHGKQIPFAPNHFLGKVMNESEATFSQMM